MALRKSAPPREDPQQYVLKKQYKKAIEIYRGIIASTPDDANQHLRLGDCLVLDGQNRPAIGEYKQAAKLFADQGFLLKAIGVNKKIVKLDPSQEEVHKSLSDLYQERGLLAGGDASSGSLAAPTTVGQTTSASGGMMFGLEDTSQAPGFDLGMEEMDEGMDLELGPQGDAVDFDGSVAADLLGDDLGGLEPELDSDLLDGLDLQPEELPERASGKSRAFEELPQEISLDALGDALAEMPEETLGTLGELGAVAELGQSDFGRFDLSPSVPVQPTQEEVAALDGLGFDFAPAEEKRPAPTSDVFRRTPLFSEFTPDEFVEVVKKMEQETYATDAVVVKEGDAGDAMFVIVSGSVRVVTNAGGQELKLAQLNEGDFFGEGSLITGKPRTATILTNEESDLLILDRNGLEEIEATHPRVRDVLTKFFKQRAESTVRTILSAKK